MADGIIGAILAALAADPTTAGLAVTQGHAPARPAATYGVARLKSWTPVLQTDTVTINDGRLELRLHAPTPEASEAAASLVQVALGAIPLEWSGGDCGPPANVTRRRESPRAYGPSGGTQAVESVELTYKARGMPGTATPGA